ncbi:MAG: exodeoxyribonuclease VII large subunit [Candidatus Eremiobacteraeota bacterium]|nr:exodeoxyribonuclease VII large subunit [Candidatus Eremiobacteraeota bacterium]MBV8499511.1 exodeoxyribonuclease VII large subunit [Candidatus Eremiobacteraeota bacterium]
MRLFGREPQVLQLTVSQFSLRLQHWLEKRPELTRIAIEGEISGWKPQSSGNVFFSLKDSRAVLKCFAGWKEVRKFPPVHDGVAVVATGAIGIWEKSSEYQLRVVAIAPLGVGAIAARVEALRKRLQAEGLFDGERKRQVSRFPHRVALVSARGQGAEDFETTLREKSPNVVVTFIETRVQGDGAEIDIAEAIDRASRSKADAIVVVRGGGSYEDRYPFNTEAVVRAIVRARHPVVTAIGHTGDRHLADEVADAVFKTPTAAAEYIAGSWAEVTARITHQKRLLYNAIDRKIVRSGRDRDAADQRLRRAIDRRLSQLRERLLQLQNRIERRNPRHRVAERGARLTATLVKLDASRDRVVSKRTNALALARSRLLSANPEGPLERGYAIVTYAGRTLRNAAEVSVGDTIEARLFHGRLAANVERVSEDE